MHRVYINKQKITTSYCIIGLHEMIQKENPILVFHNWFGKVLLCRSSKAQSDWEALVNSLLYVFQYYVQP